MLYIHVCYICIHITYLFFCFMCLDILLMSIYIYRSIYILYAQVAICIQYKLYIYIMYII